ncbi:MAG: hypothetical protein ACI857_003230, partial [Arenicella sp.]
MKTEAHKFAGGEIIQLQRDVLLVQYLIDREV